MQSVLRQFAAGMLLIQALTGWCWHCPCACAPAQQSAAVVSDDGCCCCERENFDTPVHPGPTAPDKARLQCHGICVYVSPDQATIDGPHLVRACDVPVPAATWGLQLDGVGLAWAIAHEPLKSGPPLRLHLLHEIILI